MAMGKCQRSSLAGFRISKAKPIIVFRAACEARSHQGSSSWGQIWFLQEQFCYETSGLRGPGRSRDAQVCLENDLLGNLYWH